LRRLVLETERAEHHTYSPKCLEEDFCELRITPVLLVDAPRGSETLRL
jgi:hypothetical protein